MESIGILRALLRRPWLLALGCLLALAVGVLGAYRVSLLPPGVQSRNVTAGFARQRLSLFCWIAIFGVVLTSSWYLFIPRYFTTTQPLFYAAIGISLWKSARCSIR